MPKALSWLSSLDVAQVHTHFQAYAPAESLILFFCWANLDQTFNQNLCQNQNKAQNPNQNHYYCFILYSFSFKKRLKDFKLKMQNKSNDWIPTSLWQSHLTGTFLGYLIKRGKILSINEPLSTNFTFSLINSKVSFTIL